MISSIRRLSVVDLQFAGLYKQFHEGTQVVTLSDDSRVADLWNRLVQDVDEDQLFWRQDIFQLAGNHIAGENNFGDILRFAEEQYGHVGRKVGFFPDDSSGCFHVYPSELGANGIRSNLGLDTLRMAWDLAMHIQESVSPDSFDPKKFAVSIEILKYADSNKAHEEIVEMISDSAGTWTSLGRRLDAARKKARGPFHKKFVRDLFAWGTLVPVIGKWLHSLNTWVTSGPFYAINTSEILAGPPHIDNARYLTMLCGNRDVVKTEVFDGNKWQEIPISSSELSIFPGAKIESIGDLCPVVHRYTIGGSDTVLPLSRSNVTLLIGTIPRGTIVKQARPMRLGMSAHG